MFKKPFYYGLMDFNDELHEGKHEPVISKRLFDQVQQVMERKSKPKTPQLKQYLYRGVFRCGECGCFITTETQKGHNYLRCTKRLAPCTQKYVREEQVSSQVDSFISKVALGAAIADRIITALETDRQMTAQAQEHAFQQVQAELSTCEGKLDLLLDMRLNDVVTETEYISKKHDLINTKAELKAKLELFERNQKNRFRTRYRLHN